MTAAACADRPSGTLAPTGRTVPGATIVDMLTVTTRAPSTRPGVGFSDARGQGVSFDNVLVSVPPPGSREPGQLIYPTQGAADPSREFVVVGRQLLTEDQAGGWFRHAQPDGGDDLLVFVHGFNTRHEEAVYRFAQLVHDAGIEAAPVLFTWPSRGSVFDYLYDRESANFSRGALERSIDVAATAPEVGSITIMAHSMGAWLTMEALHQSALRNGGLSPKIANVVLASPDIDIDVFMQQLRDIDTERTRITIFTSVDDRALLASRRLAGGVTRLGQLDLQKPGILAAIEDRGVTVIDLSKLKSNDPLNHSRFANSPAAVQIIGRRLAEGQTLSEGSPGIGETLQATAVGTLRTVGSTVGAAGALPAALISDAGRDDLGARIDDVAGNLGGTVLTATGQ
ncbi:alpha/beta hydrolase [Paracoccus sp. 1_MG-2023]|uniref:alpha/beta hydrolase n=1 Tax=unclassified Paracoccus (in: a-proteobacteria) TaxID=2688777 RepID=UPI001C090CEE|nr:MULTISPECIES: alpha/beta hydrolase [unclassified Paracoccus (in: a-proteobacteria)]MBU2957629.1 alpha/beta hydrolase [Paracoccus sp. C2R09]MDO6667524.1 alpha/beta hydrolase [Paracoccus sp. 1_MG-2023]